MLGPSGMEIIRTEQLNACFSLQHMRTNQQANKARNFWGLDSTEETTSGPQD